MKTKIKLLKPFTDKCFGNFVDGAFWITDGHIALNTNFYDNIKLPKECEYFVKNRQVFAYQNKAIVTDSVPDIAKIIPQGPRYILVKTSLIQEDINKRQTSIFYGHDRFVYLDKVFTDIIYNTPLIGDFNVLQNYDKPLGPVSFYSIHADIETSKPCAIVSPMRQSDELERLLYGNLQDMTNTIDNERRKAIA